MQRKISTNPTIVLIIKQVTFFILRTQNVISYAVVLRNLLGSNSVRLFYDDYAFFIFGNYYFLAFIRNIY
ncbi:hypothetical protein SAMN05660197_1876 [Nitratiruptor tergarcus DSM 16512]|uniref:Uncharacterized protein n=1 Tax=Nitratiruptor tergarcus DSM 16512 TaxID=1069081 RepID=A0A1W1WV05_9BACT|nr:hypothetical protein SAMN05660197_1876 [Nitratiruptor tergarcus DSM 16512]